MSNLTPVPLGKRVLLVKDDAAEASEGGIILPSESREQPLEARVVAVGHLVTQVAKDDMVIFAAFAGTTFTIGDQDVIVLDEEDIMLVLREVGDDNPLPKKLTEAEWVEAYGGRSNDNS